jgi:hypothetical protein
MSSVHEGRFRAFMKKNRREEGYLNGIWILSIIVGIPPAKFLAARWILYKFI